LWLSVAIIENRVIERKKKEKEKRKEKKGKKEKKDYLNTRNSS